MPEEPFFRPDVIVSPQESDGKKFYVLKDPLTRKFFRVKEPEYLVIQNLDGKTSLEEIIQKLQTQFGLSATSETIDQFITQLESYGFLVSEESSRETTRLAYQTKRPKSLFQKIIFIKLKAFDPNALLDRLFPRFRFTFTRVFILPTFLAVLIGIYITIDQWGEFSYSLSSLYKLSSILGIWLTAFWVVSLHEFAHAFSCKLYGGEVREMGFLLLYFQPCFYCNLSDAWLFPERSKKLLVGFSGAYFQIFIWAMATVIWRITDQEAFINQFAFITMITSGVLVLFNFNPLIKLDGYYLLSDYLQIPNLRKKAFHYLGNWFKRYILRLPVELPPASAKEKKVFPVYGILALIYSALLLGFVFWKMGEFLISRLEGVGFVLYSLLLLVIFKTPLQILAAGFGQFLLFKKESMKSPKKLVLNLSVIILILALLILVKINLKVSRPCEISAVQTYTLSNQSQAYVAEEKLFIEGSEEKRSVNYFRTISSQFGLIRLNPVVKEGQKVQAGELVASMASNQYLNDLKTAEAKIGASRASYELLKKGPRKEEIGKARDKVGQLKTQLTTKEQEHERWQKLWEQKLVSQQEWDRANTEYEVLKSDLAIAENELNILLTSPRPEELDKAKAELEQLEAQAAYYREQVESSQIKTPISGVVTKVRPSGDIVSIVRYDSVLIMIPVAEKDMDIVQVGQMTRAKVKSYPGKTFLGKVTKVPTQGELLDNHTVFWVTAKTSNADFVLKPGMTGRAKIYCGKRPILSIVIRKVVRWFRVEIWSWF